MPMSEEVKARVAEIDAAIEQKRQELATIEGTQTEVYTRIVGYYRSLKNWNKGKREEYDHRMMFDPNVKVVEAATIPVRKEEKRTTFIPEKATFKGVADFGKVAV